jgi:hypothetical protein
MKLNLLLYILILSVFSSCNKYSERIEYKIFECNYKSLPNNGASFKNVINEFENHLIEQKVLKDNSGESYLSIYQNIAIGEKFNFIPSDDFFDMLKSFKDSQFKKINDCEKELYKTDEYKLSKVYKIKTKMDSIKDSGKLTVESIAIGMLTILNEKDFELDYYKFRTFGFINALNNYEKTSRKSTKYERLEY